MRTRTCSPDHADSSKTVNVGIAFMTELPTFRDITVSLSKKTMGKFCCPSIVMKRKINFIMQ